jgi:hypothetical protein
MNTRYAILGMAAAALGIGVGSPPRLDTGQAPWTHTRAGGKNQRRSQRLREKRKKAKAEAKRHARFQL